jgi:hypothetical protein
VQLALRRERGDPGAQIAEGGGLAFDGEIFGAGLEHGYLHGEGG